MLLPWLILIPFIGGFLCWQTERFGVKVPRWIALITMGLTLALSLQLWLQGGYSLTQSAGIPQWQSEFDMPWIPRFGISIHLAIDGLSLLMVVLTGLLGVLAVLCSWKEIEKYQGFFHLHAMSGDVTEAQLHYIIRDHDRDRFEARKALFHRCADAINAQYGPGTASAVTTDSYYNMKEKILPHMDLIHRAEDAFRKNDVTPLCVPIRGGTDGARLSWDGLPCPNLSTGGYNFHGVREWIPAASLDAMAAVLADLVSGFAQ